MKKTIAIMFTALSLGMTAQTKMTNHEDSKFAMEAAKASAKEIKLGQLAASKGSSAEVKQLGQMMVDDHTKASNELKTLAERKGLKLPAEKDEEFQKAYDALSKKSGKDFDKAYTEMMVRDHKKVIGEFQMERDNGKDDDIKSWAQTTLPTLEHHLKMSEDAHKNAKM